MTPTEACQAIAARLGIEATEVQLLGTYTVTSKQGDLIVRTVYGRFRISSKGYVKAALAVDQRIAPAWRPSKAFVAAFAKTFKGLSGTDRVVSALSGPYSSRIGAKHIADIAHVLGKGSIAGFEVRYQPAGLTAQSIDIRTKHGIAIEGKAFARIRRASKSDLALAVEQASRRLCPPVSGPACPGVIIVYPNGALDASFGRQPAQNIFVCELDDVHSALKNLIDRRV
jgi:hypothetical protein